MKAADILKEQTPACDENSGESVQNADDRHIDGLLILAPQLMIAGYAIECLLKGIWVKQGNQIVKGDGSYAGVTGASDHDLVQLAQVIQFSLTDQEKDVLKRLSFYVTSGGRYPVPRKWVHTKIQDHGRVMGPPSYWNGGDYKITDAIIVRLTEELDS